MNAKEFHSGLRALRNIDRSDLTQAGVIPRGLDGDKDWEEFHFSPYHFAIRIDDDRYERLFGLVKERVKVREGNPS